MVDHCEMGFVALSLAVLGNKPSDRKRAFCAIQDRIMSMGVQSGRAGLSKRNAFSIKSKLPDRAWPSLPALKALINLTVSDVRVRPA